MKPNVAKLLRKAVAYHEAGQVDKAEPLYSSVLENDPGNADAWHLLGRAALQRGEWKAAAARVLQAIRRQPAAPAFHTTLGEILAAQGRSWDASLCYQEALRLSPRFIPALVNLGNALQEQGHYRDACVAYWRAIQAQPDCAEAFNNLGNALRAEGRGDEAVACFLEALRLRPDYAEAKVNLAAAHLAQGRNAEAEEWARRALRDRPGLVQGLSNLSVALLNQQKYGEAGQAAREALACSPAAAHLHSNLASVLLQQKKFAEAEIACRQALQLRPDYPEARNNLGVALQFCGRLEEAAREFEDVVVSRPGFVEAWTNLGTVRQGQARHAEALDCFGEALRLNPEHEKSHFCHSLSLLSAGRLREGFAEYEWRWKVLETRPRAWQQPQWDGSPLAGTRILLHAEQGLGDTVQFVRYAPLVAALGGHVIVECREPLAALVSTMRGVSETITPEVPLPEFEVQAPFMSLPHILGTSLDTIPAEIPYLRADPALVALVRKELGKPAGPRVGLVWAGNRDHANDHRRSIPVEMLAPLSEITGIEWYSLQGGERARIEAPGWMREISLAESSVAGLAAAICSMDLVISVDTMPAHLAGALGRKVWTLLPRAADWRWLEAREDSLWYPTMRLFRQPVQGDWSAVVERVGAEIRRLPLKDSESAADERE